MDPFFAAGGETGALMQRLDWQKTAIGLPAQWPTSLRTTVRIMLTSRYPMWLGWGPELTMIYNDPYARILGTKHPGALGSPAREVWREIWGEVGPRIEQVLSTGRATFDEALLLIMERHGYPEETYFTFSYSPLSDDGGRIAGNFCVLTEDTDRVIGARRLAVLRDLAARLAVETGEDEVFRAAGQCLAGEPRDLPFTRLYRFDGTSGLAHLASQSGFSEIADGETIDPDDPAAPWGLYDIARGVPAATLACPRDPSIPRGRWDVPPASVLVLPIANPGQGAPPAGAFVVGLNPYRPLDDDYHSFIHLIAGQIGAALANARAHEEERRRVEALAEIDRAKTAFFSNVSHEFRTPLTLMLGPTEEALAGDGVMRREQLETVYRNELRLLKLVNSLLDFSRLEAGRAQAVYEPTDLGALTADVATTFRSTIERGGLRFDVDCPPLPEPIYVDPQMWEKILLNLLSNAFKFTLDGAITVRQHWTGDHVVLTVEDTGGGIPQQELGRVFDRFHRIEGTRARTHEGSGIGLALVRDLVKLHGGDITVESELDRGTTFTVTLPAGHAHLDPARIATRVTAVATAAAAHAYVVEAERWLDGSWAPAPEGPPSVASDAPTRGHIVLADDNADMRDYLQRLLGQRWEVEAVGNGAQALLALRRRRPDLLITDVMMPELDGFGLVSAIRTDPALSDLPILMLSARAGEEARLEGLQSGADDYLVKPFSARELIAHVEMQLLRASIRAVENLQRRQLADIFHQAPAAIAIVRGPDHTYEFANPAYMSLIGGRAIIGKPVREALPELVSQGICELLDNVFVTGQPHVGKAVRMLVTREPGGEPAECYFDFVYQPMRDATGAIDGIAIVAFEVSDLARARREAEAANRTKDEFLAMLGHELRNPLAPMLTALQLMRLRADPSTERERVVIERQTRHLVRLVDDLLDVSRIARGKIELRLERIDIADVVAKAIEMASPLLEEREHDLKLDVGRGIMVDADPARLAQVIANLLTNAAKYTGKGGVIAVRGVASDGAAVISVRDSGIGIAPDMLPRVFDMFAQERQALARTQGGLGLGLTIVRNLTELHGGTVDARSEGRNRGSEFTVRIPLATGAAAPETAIESRAAARASEDGPSVLIVDDNHDAATMLSAWVESLGYRVQSAPDGPAALRAVEKSAPGIALLDIGLPVMDGYELAARLRQTPHGAAMKLIAITGYGQPADRERSREAGFDAHLVKPVDLEVLADLLEELSV